MFVKFNAPTEYSEFVFMASSSKRNLFSPVCECIGHCLGRNDKATLFSMKKSNRHLSRQGRMFLVLMLVFASIVPGTLHAAAMAGPGVDNGSGHHDMGHSSGDHMMADHHQFGDVQTASGTDPQPVGAGHTADRCCMAACSFALCSFEPETTTVFIPDNFEIEAMLGFVVTAIALPERPPRV